MLLPEWANKFVKGAAILIGVVADGIMLFACFTSQTSDLMGKVAFGTLGIMIILLIPILYNERAYKLWLCAVTVAIFFDTSFLLAQTDTERAQIVATVENDQELKRLTIKADSAAAALQKKQDEYDKSQNGATLRELNNQINQAREDSKISDKARQDRFNAIESGAVVLNPLTSQDIFDAIPKALRSGRQLQAFMYGLIAIIIQGMIVFALSEKIKRRNWFRDILGRILESVQDKIEQKLDPKLPPVKSDEIQQIGPKVVKKWSTTPRDIVEKFVKTNWIGFKSNKSKKILSQQSFIEFYSTRGGFSIDDYKRLKQLSIDRGVISPGDEIIIFDENKAIGELMR
jgi:antitoxin component HigA of HigAB toxin-antitoxin module